MELAEAVAQAVPASGVVAHKTPRCPLLVVEAASALDVLRFLRDDPSQSYKMLTDLTAVDRVAGQGQIEVVYTLRSLEHGNLLIVKAAVPADNPVIDSATGLWHSANWAEREVWDMFGVHFEGHPDLRRILMYEEFVGYPLRKDYPANGVQPLIPFREEAVGKLPPFDLHEGMPFGRQTHRQLAHARFTEFGPADDGTTADQLAEKVRRNALGFEEER